MGDFLRWLMLGGLLGAIILIALLIFGRAGRESGGCRARSSYRGSGVAGPDAVLQRFRAFARISDHLALALTVREQPSHEKRACHVLSAGFAVASHRPYRSFRPALQVTVRVPIQSERRRAAFWPQRHSVPSGPVHVCRLSGASMSKRRMRLPWISSVSPSITVARPAMVSARGSGAG